MYTGGLENHPDVVDQLAATRPLLGNAAAVLRAVRDPWRVAAALQRHGLPSPRCQRAGTSAALGGQWLLKRQASAGGAGVREWRGTLPRTFDAERCFLQERIIGRSCAAVYVAAAGRAELLGVTEQLIGADWCGARGFQYCGSVGPLRLADATLEQFRSVGQCLAAEFQLAGLFGVDAIVNRRGVWPVEVNPRYTASIEVLERALGVPAVRWHVEACLDRRLPPSPGPTSGPRRWCGKAILFARENIEIDERLCQGMLNDRSCADAWPSVADVPAAGSHIAAHRPIMTLLSAGRGRQMVLSELQTGAARWHEKLAARRT
jgi:predicted ATP-grasp superfamily ATP-dependent carboligase